tara:strand:- start:163 stop:777 length:615 start_codon:yes stop_codon:yes gene_type:complete
MLAKKLVQIILLISISLVLYLSVHYIKSKKFDKSKKIEIEKKEIKKINKSIESKKNFIKNISYVSTDNNGNKYEISSKIGIIDFSNKDNSVNDDTIIMEKVTAQIYLKNLEVVIITSDLARYNQKNYHTIFENNVQVLYNEQIINSEKTELLFNDGLVKISNNVIYQNLNMVLNADIVEIDLVKKSSKIFMNETSKKIKATYKN